MDIKKTDRITLMVFCVLALIAFACAIIPAQEVVNVRVGPDTRVITLGPAGESFRLEQHEIAIDPITMAEIRKFIEEQLPGISFESAISNPATAAFFIKQQNEVLKQQDYARMQRDANRALLRTSAIGVLGDAHEFTSETLAIQID